MGKTVEEGLAARERLAKAMSAMEGRVFVIADWGFSKGEYSLSGYAMDRIASLGEGEGMAPHVYFRFSAEKFGEAGRLLRPSTPDFPLAAFGLADMVVLVGDEKLSGLLVASLPPGSRRPLFQCANDLEVREGDAAPSSERAQPSHGRPDGRAA